MCPECARWNLTPRRTQLVTAGAYMAGWPILLATLAYRGWLRRRPVVRALAESGNAVTLRGIHAKRMRRVPARVRSVLRTLRGADLP